jgi:hypothetical protein
MKNKIKNKRGISEILGYILLISFAVFMSFIVYQGLKTYVPVGAIECPDGVSIFVSSSNCTLNDEKYDLTAVIKNNGRHNIAGYYIHASNNSEQEVATIDLVRYLNKQGGQVGNISSLVVFIQYGEGAISTMVNSVNVSDRAYASYEGIPTKIYSVDIIPVRFQKEGNRLRQVSCGKAVVREKITCP